MKSARQAVVAAVILLGLFRPAAAADPAVVTLIVRTAQGPAFGSGSFISADGIVLTCYHVVEGATSISLLSGRAMVSDNSITVESVDPDHDLATLRVRDPQLRFTYFPLTNDTPAPADDLWILGYVGGLPNQAIQVHTTQAGFAQSGKILDGAVPVFEDPDVDLIPVNTLMYRGMSGSPLVFGQKTIGVISGSLGEGGTLAWAIPVRYLESASTRVLGQHASAIAWAPLTLMGGSWSNLRRQLTIDPAMATALGDLIDSASKAGELIGRAYPAARAEYVRTLPKLRALVASIPQSEDSLRIADSPGFAAIEKSFYAAGEEMSDGLEKVNDMLDEVDREIGYWKNAANKIDKRFEQLHAAEARTQIQVPIRDVLEQIKQIDDEQDASTCNLKQEETSEILRGPGGGEASSYSSGKLDPDMTVAVLRVATSEGCLLEGDTYFKKFQKIFATMRGIGAGVQGILEESVLQRLAR